MAILHYVTTATTLTMVTHVTRGNRDISRRNRYNHGNDSRRRTRTRTMQRGVISKPLTPLNPHRYSVELFGSILGVA